jgi:hypothetical protein
MFARFFSTATKNSTNSPAYEIASRFAKLKQNEFAIRSFQETILAHSQGTVFWQRRSNARLASLVQNIEKENQQLNAELDALNKQHPEFNFKR